MFQRGDFLHKMTGNILKVRENPLLVVTRTDAPIEKFPFTTCSGDKLGSLNTFCPCDKSNQDKPRGCEDSNTNLTEGLILPYSDEKYIKNGV